MPASIQDAPIPIADIDLLVVQQTGQSLSDLQRVVLQECWQASKKTYEAVAAEYNYSSSYIQQRVAPSLWRLLSEAVGSKVTKSNCKGMLLSRLASQPALPTVSVSAPLEALPQAAPQATSLLPLPSESVPLNSPFYIQRPPFEPDCYGALHQQGALVRIKAPRQMGKTSLMNRILAHSQDCRSVVINFQQADQAIMGDLDRLLRWFCANLMSQLKLNPTLDDLWSSDLGSKMSCTLCVEEVVLAEVDGPIAIALEEASELFEYPSVAQDFFAMLRTWHEYTKSDDAWAPLRLLLVQSTETYIPLNINQSPFNVGIELALTPFTLEQISTLAERYGLNLDRSVIEQIFELLGGHPHLTGLTLYHLAQSDMTWEQVVATAATDEGIFSPHLHRHLWALEQHSDLQNAFQQVLSSQEPVMLPQVQTFKLQSMGLVKLQQNCCTVSHKLYQQYFSHRLSGS
ncbi:MAG: AAA-like domain-containing protein [Cyanobacteria bacterium J06632_22]